MDSFHSHLWYTFPVTFRVVSPRVRTSVQAAVAFLLTAFLTVPITVSAQLTTNSTQAAAEAAGISGGPDLLTIIGRVIYVALGTLGVIFLCLLLYAGWRYMISQGDPKRVQEAKTTIKNSIIGLVVIASSWAIVAFVLGLLNGIAGGGIGTNSTSSLAGFGSSSAGSACLGQGIIEANFPARDANAIPRNTPIMLTFKQPIDPASFIADWTLQTSSTHTGLNSNVIKIYKTTDGESTSLQPENARVAYTSDFKTFVIRPVDYLGSPTVSVGYTVALKSGLSGVLKKDGTPAFSGACASGYAWQFETNTIVDLTPPHVVAATPVTGGNYPRNVVVQMTFSKAMDPTTVTGRVSMPASSEDIQTLSVQSGGGAATSPVAGQFTISNQYQTIEFVPDLPCGTNSCGRTVYCLPSNQPIQVNALAATVDPKNPPQAQLISGGSSGLYNGIVDVDGNSLDGNDNGHGDGPPSDNYPNATLPWSFGTTGDIRLSPPQILNVAPAPGAGANSHVPLDQQVQATFDSVLQVSTLNSQNILLNASGPGEKAVPDTFWWSVGEHLLSAGGVIITDTTSTPYQSQLFINHRPYLPSGTDSSKGDPNNYYNPHITSGVQDEYQNCFNPARECKGYTGSAEVNCCNGNPQDTDCAFN